jgi:hypothetical protein
VRVDRQWLIIYCNAVKAWSLTGDFKGEDATRDFYAMAERKDQMTKQLESKGVTRDCRTVPPTEHFDN